MKHIKNHIFVTDMVNSLSCIIDPESAARGIRALCRYFGGQMIYVPQNKFDGDAAEKIRGVLSDEVGDADAEKILEKFMMFYGRMQVYIPLERTGFKKDIALEIYEKFDGTQKTMNELCREYNITFAHVYKFLHKARDLKRAERARKNQLELFN